MKGDIVPKSKIIYLEYIIEKYAFREGSFIFTNKSNCPICEMLEQPRIEFIKREEMTI
jgi:hypothetical protein